MDVGVVHHQMDGLGVGVFESEAEESLRKLEAGTIQRWESEVAPDFRFYATENISRPAALDSLSRLASRPGTAEGGRTIGVQPDRLLV